MRLKLWIQTVVLSTLVAGIASADTKWYDLINFGGHVQGSYVANLSKDTPRTNQLRVYDANNGFNLNQAQLRISKAIGAEDHWGFTTKLLAGHDAGLIHSAGLGTESTSFDVQEAYATWSCPKTNIVFTGGKFVTTAGVEVIESVANLAIEPGLLFFYGMPFTHTGAKAGYTFNDKVTFTAGLVNGWDQVTDGNPGKSIIYQLATTPLPGLTANLSGSYGPELFNTYSAATVGTSNSAASGNNNISKRMFLDLVLGYTGIDKLSINAEALWGQDSNIGGVSNSGKSNWAGLGLWSSYAVNNYLNPGVRLEVFRDQNNAGRLTAGTNQTAKEFTILNKFVTSSNTFARLQYRHDWSNRAAYTRSDGTGTRNQNTISLDWSVVF